MCCLESLVCQTFKLFAKCDSLRVGNHLIVNRAHLKCSLRNESFTNFAEVLLKGGHLQDQQK